MPDDFVLNVRQIFQYPRRSPVAGDLVLLQNGSVGAGPYFSAQVDELVSSALMLSSKWLRLAPGNGIAWNGAALSFAGGQFAFTDQLAVPSLHARDGIFVAGNAVATQVNVNALLDKIVANTVWSINGRRGDVLLETADILRAGAAPIRDAHFGGHITAPTAWDFRSNDDTVATTGFVQMAVGQLLCSGSVVTRFNTRGGAVTLTTEDVNDAYFATSDVSPRAPSPPLGNVSTRIATTAFVDESVADLRAWTAQQIDKFITADYLNLYAPLASPAFTGYATAPTAPPGASTGQLATTAFVMNAVAGSVAGVASFNTRTGNVVLASADVTAAGGALLVSPVFTGTPQAPTATPGTSTIQLASTAFVQAAIAGATAGVASFNTRTGAVTLTLTDVTGTGVLANTALTGVPTAPTAAVGTATTQLATTAFVLAEVAAISAGVTTFNGRAGNVTFTAADLSAVGGALLASPNFSGVATVPTAPAGISTTQIASTAFVMAAIAGSTAGVASFNGRSGAVTMILADVTGAGGAPIANPSFTGAVMAPTPGAGDASTLVATTAFVAAAIAPFASTYSPALTGIPTAPTAAVGTATTQLATTAFVYAAIAAVAAGVTSFNGRSGAVTFAANDLSAAGGALLASPAFSGTPTAPTPSPGLANTQLATTAYVTAAVAAAGGVASFNGRGGAVTLTLADVTTAGAVNRAGDTMTGPLRVAEGVGITNPAREWSMGVNPDGSLVIYDVTALNNYFAITVGLGTVVNYAFYVNGQGYKPGGGAWGDSSDARIKTVSGDYGHGLAEILQLQPVIYRFKGNDSREQPSGNTVPYPNSPHFQAAKDNRRFVGLVAQDLEITMPEMVTRVAGHIDGKAVADLRNLDSTPLIFALVNAVKELAGRLSALETRLARST